MLKMFFGLSDVEVGIHLQQNALGVWGLGFLERSLMGI